jgi:hypothetical protein
MSDVLVALEALLPDLPAAADQRRLGDRLSQATQTLREAAQQARRLRAVLQIGEAVGFGAGPDQREMVQELRQTALDVAEALERADDPESLRTAVWDYEKSLLVALANVDRAVRVQWRGVVANRFQPLIGFGDLLSMIDGVSDLGRDMTACGRRAQALDGGSAEELAIQIQALLADFDRLQAERATAIGAGDVGTFLNALAERCATLAMVTDEVRAWLETNQALDQFSVTPT